MRYELHWKCVPMDAISAHENWYDPYLGKGVYMLVVATSRGEYVGFYIGKSDDIGKRWREHLHERFNNPHEGYWIPISADEFLKDPVRVFNEERTAQGLENRFDTQKRILDATWFCFAEVYCLRPWHKRQNIEYVLQQALKTHIGITVDGHIGDIGHGRPRGLLEIHNHFGRPFLAETLPPKIRFADGDRIEIA